MSLHCAFYRFAAFAEERLPALKPELKRLGVSLGLRGTVLLAREGINGFVAGAAPAVRAFEAALERIPELRESGPMDFKESPCPRPPYSRMLVKIKAEIIAMGEETLGPENLRAGAAQRLTAEELSAWIDSGKQFVLLDTRNDYEIPFGSFEGARELGIKTFKEFPRRFREVAHEFRGQPVVMFCTGGIRCEKAGKLALREGLEEVYQLDGGILRYLERMGKRHYRGDCFVFDHRLAVGENLDTVHDLRQCIRCQYPLMSPSEGQAPTCWGCERGLSWNEKGTAPREA